MGSQSTDSGSKTAYFGLLLSEDENRRRPTRNDILYLQKKLRAHSFDIPLSAFDSRRGGLKSRNRVQRVQVCNVSTETMRKTYRIPKKAPRRLLVSSESVTTQLCSPVSVVPNEKMSCQKIFVLLDHVLLLVFFACPTGNATNSTQC